MGSSETGHDGSGDRIAGAPLPPARVRRFYDRFGRLQDTQAFYEDAAVDDLVAHGDFGAAHRVVEVGCGTGRLARRLLDHELPPDATYLGVEISPRTAAIARDRLRPHGDRAAVTVADAVRAWPGEGSGADRVVATYVFDLLGPDETATLLGRAAGALASDGLLCAAGLTDGRHGVARAVSGGWSALWRRWPGLVGGCRPVRLAEPLTATGWQLVHVATVTAWALSSEVVVARPPGTAAPR